MWKSYNVQEVRSAYDASADTYAVVRDEHQDSDQHHTEEKDKQTTQHEEPTKAVLHDPSYEYAKHQASPPSR
ncbi:MAG: hypothetical protein ACKPKO_30465 [Candidatus Fonsibacter sp.]